ncbi:MAG: hypothetical protein SO434_04275 [Eubacteriales bacterium]|nr:hypothetical protein [Eubacteriales bacterium]
MKSIEQVKTELKQMRRQNILLQSMYDTEARLRKRLEYLSDSEKVERDKIEYILRNLDIAGQIRKCNAIEKEYAKAISKLSLEDSTIIYARYQQGMTNVQIARNFYYSVDGMQKRINRLVHKIWRIVNE